MRFFNFTLIGMRTWATPLIIMVADTILAYTLVSSIASGVLASWYRVAEIVEWSDMVRRIEERVRLLNTRVLADRRKLDEITHRCIKRRALRWGSRLPRRPQMRMTRCQHCRRWGRCRMSVSPSGGARARA